MIHEDTGCSIRDITNILNSLGNVVKDKFSDRENHIEIKLFPGLKVTSKYVPLEHSRSNLSDYIKANDMLFVSAKFSKRFKDSIRELQKQ